jgi:hypothetical protein
MLPVTEAHMTPHKTHKQFTYSDAERAILGKYKEAYLATISQQEQDQLLRGGVFPDIFNYWHARDSAELTKEKMVIQKKVKHN